MKIVSRQELMQMPSGTLFHEWEPCMFHHLQIKRETCGVDFYVTAIPELDVHDSDEDVDVQIAMNEKGVSRDLDFSGFSREALFDDTKRYAVWEPHDLDEFISFLLQCRNGTLDK